jgi:ABC-type Mn2+/Zn2+ transport system permease subunit
MTQGLIGMIDILTLILTSPFLQRALLGALMISIIASTSGSFMVFRGLSFMTSGVAHAALGGASLGFFLQASGILPWFDPIFGALLFSALIAIITGYAGESGSPQKMEVAVGVGFALSMSLAVFLMYYIPPEDALSVFGLLVGDPFLLTDTDIMVLALLTVILILVMVFFGKEFIYVSVDYEGSLAYGMNARAYHYLLLILSAMAISLAVKAVGAILVYAIMVAPAAASTELMKSVRGVVFMVFSLAMISQVLGIGISFIISVSPSAVAGLLAAFSYVIALQIKRFRERREVSLAPPSTNKTTPQTIMRESETQGE